MKRILQSDRIVPPLLLGVAILAYGLFIPKLGLFGDDWPHLWVFHMFGLDGLDKLVAWDRPFSAWVYGLIAPIAGENIWGYHVYLLLLRWAGAVIFYFIVKELLPKSQPVPLWTALFFLIYPGFRQQPQPLEFILHFTVLLFLLLSFYLMIKASQNGKYWLIFQSCGSIFSLSLYSVEYFIGLELLRPIILWVTTSRDNLPIKTRIFRVGKYWLPYLLVLGSYAYWRVLVFRFPTYKPTFLSYFISDPIHSLTGLTQVLVEEIRSTVLGAWRQVITLPLQTEINIAYTLLIFGTFVLIYFWLSTVNPKNTKTTPWVLVGIGGVAVFLAGIPFWITGIPIQLDFPWDRSTLPFMVGVSMLLSGGLLIFKPFVRNILVSMLVAASVGMHYQNAVNYQIEWDKLRQFFWQLSWRAPGLTEGTIVISEDIPLFYYGDNNLTPILNWIYAPGQKTVDIPYNFFDMGERLGHSLPDLAPGLPVSHGYRFVTFKSTSDKLLPVYFKAGQCLKVVDAENENDGEIPERLKKAARFSHPNDLIINQQMAVLPPFISEPERDWCYFYQKAELAAQFKQWDLIEQLWIQAEENKLAPIDSMEIIPFLEAKIHTLDFEGAVLLSNNILGKEGQGGLVCKLWQDGLQANPLDNSKFIEGMNALGCENPHE